jgi:hypothetical protein
MLFIICYSPNIKEHTTMVLKWYLGIIENVTLSLLIINSNFAII